MNKYPEDMTRPLEDALNELETAARHVREALAPQTLPAGPELWARQMLSVLSEVDKRGGKVAQVDFLAIGERYGYQRRGMAGFYQQLVRAEGGEAVLTDLGRSRLSTLRAQHEPLPPADLGATFATDTDPFVLHVNNPRNGSGTGYDAETAKRELYRA
jgi:hypothetical protein